MVRRRLQPHGFAVLLNLDDWMERAAAITGQFYELEVTALIERCLRPGDSFVDVGGNLGFVSLTAARRIGHGRLIYVEPNPVLAERFAETCDANGIVADIRVQALGERSGRAALAISDHSGTARLVEGDAVTVGTLDDLPLPHDAPCFIKIDVEGYEEQVLAGAGRTLRRLDCAFLIEVTDQWLRYHGGSAARLFETMLSLGYEARLLTFERRGLILTDLSAPLDRHQYDVLFARLDWLRDRAAL